MAGGVADWAAHWVTHCGAGCDKSTRKLRYDSAVVVSRDLDMSFWNRLGRVFEALDDKSRYGADAFGRKGVLEGQSRLGEDGLKAWIDPVVTGRNGKPFSIPALVWGEGSLFCVDFRHWVGRLEFKAVTKTIEVKEKVLFWDVTREEEERVGTDYTQIVKTKDGNWGEGSFEMTFKHPLTKPKAYIHALKSELAKQDDRWARFPIHPVVCFAGEHIDLGGVHSLSRGLIYPGELPEFIRQKQNEKFVGRPSTWMIRSLDGLSTWDRVQTRNQEMFQGTLRTDHIDVHFENGVRALLFKDVDEINITRDGSFSDRDVLEIWYTDGSVSSGWCRNQIVVMEDPWGEKTDHRIRNLRHILVDLSRS